MPVTEERVCYSQFPRAEATLSAGGPRGEAPGLARRCRERESNCGQEPLLWFPQKGTGEAG